MSAIIGTQIISPVVPTDTTDEYSTHIDTYGRGGWRSVADNTERDAITTDRRVEGMLVYVRDTDVSYVLKDGITNSDWVVYTATGAQGATGSQGATGVGMGGGGVTGVGNQYSAAVWDAIGVLVGANMLRVSSSGLKVTVGYDNASYPAAFNVVGATGIDGTIMVEHKDAGTAASVVHRNNAGAYSTHKLHGSGASNLSYMGIDAPGSTWIGHLQAGKSDTLDFPTGDAGLAIGTGWAQKVKIGTNSVARMEFGETGGVEIKTPTNIASTLGVTGAVTLQSRLTTGDDIRHTTNTTGWTGMSDNEVTSGLTGMDPNKNRWQRVGNIVDMWIDFGSGATGWNQDPLYMNLPFAAGDLDQTFIIRAVSAGSSNVGFATIQANQSYIGFYKDMSGNLWTNAGTRTVAGHIRYHTA